MAMPQGRLMRLRKLLIYYKNLFAVKMWLRIGGGDEFAAILPNYKPEEIRRHQRD